MLLLRAIKLLSLFTVVAMTFLMLEAELTARESPDADSPS
jgi:hypothetical protein